MNRRKTIHDLCLLCCALACPALLGCDVPAKQIGQLDSSDTDTDDGDPLPASCQAGIDNLEELLEGQDPDLHCALVLRSDYETGEILGWQLPCRGIEEPELDVDDAVALTTWGGENISNDERNFIVYNEPIDATGGLAYVGTRTGLAFDASIEIGGMGQITEPSDLLDADFLGSGCFAAGPEFAVELWTYDMTGSEEDPFAYTPAMEQALDAIFDTGAFHVEGFAAAAVLAYPRTVGPFDPTSAEVVTILDRGSRND